MAAGTAINVWLSYYPYFAAPIGLVKHTFCIASLSAEIHFINTYEQTLK